MPAPVAAAADTHELGAPVAIHRPNRSESVLTVFMYVAIVPGSVGMFGTFHHFPAVLIPVAFAIYLAASIVRSVRHRDRSYLYEFERGLVRACKSTVETVAWADVDYFAGQSLRRPDGTTVFSLPYHHERMAIRIGDLALAQARLAMRNTGAARFGPVTVTRDGLTIDDDFLAWAAIDSIDHDYGTLSVRRNSGQTMWTGPRTWKRVPADQVPNVHALVTLAVAHISGTSEQTTPPPTGDHPRPRP